MTKKTAKTIKNALKELLLQETATSQETLCHILQAQGFDHANQSKISRLLKQLGAVKIKNAEGQSVYTLKEDIIPPSTNASFQHLVIDIAANESLVIVRTSPGSASLIARLLDYHRKNLHILGTLAGDDTVFIAPISVKKIPELTKKITALLCLA